MITIIDDQRTVNRWAAVTVPRAGPMANKIAAMKIQRCGLISRIHAALNEQRVRESNQSVELLVIGSRGFLEQVVEHFVNIRGVHVQQRHLLRLGYRQA